MNAVKKTPAPFIFLLVMGATIMLIIFFGAWAVAADIEGRELTFSLTGSTPDNNPNASNSNASGQPPAAFGAAPIGETPDSGAASTWWGKGFLKACPLH